MLIRPRLTDHHGVTLAQEDADFAIPFFDEDIPLYVDPFLMWRSPSQQDMALHGALITAFNHLGHLALHGRENDAVEALIAASECDEVGLGSSKTRQGKRIGPAKAKEILAVFSRIPHYATEGLTHIEELQFFVEGISRDRISDFACSFLKSFLIDFTIDAVLGPNYLPFGDFAEFESDDVPSTSDVALVLAQYIEEAERYRSDNVKYWQSKWVYIVDGEPSDIQSGSPTKVGKK